MFGFSFMASLSLVYPNSTCLDCVWGKVVQVIVVGKNGVLRAIKDKPDLVTLERANKDGHTCSTI